MDSFDELEEPVENHVPAGIDESESEPDKGNEKNKKRSTKVKVRRLTSARNGVVLIRALDTKSKGLFRLINADRVDLTNKEFSIDLNEFNDLDVPRFAQT